MDIKYIHVTLIVVSILLYLGFCFWLFLHQYPVWGIVSLAGAVILIIYCLQFIKKMKVL